jgi:hypothetical protein
MSHSIERLRANAISLMESLWNYGQTIHTVRLFVDFRVPQMIIHCFLNSAARFIACEFVNDAIAAIRLRSFEPTFVLLQTCIHQPTVMALANLALRSSAEEVRQQAVNIINRILYGDCASAIMSLVIADVLWLVADHNRDPLVEPLISDALVLSSPVISRVLCYSVPLQRALGYVEPKPLVVPHHLDINSALEFAKRLASSLFIRQSSVPPDLGSSPAPREAAISFLIRAIGLALTESDLVAGSLDCDVKQATRFDLKGTTFLKAKCTARNTDFGDTQLTIQKLCDALLHLFRCLCFYWREPGTHVASDLFEYILTTMVAPVPKCDSMPHPAFLIHHCLQRMVMHCLVDLPDDSPARDAVASIQDLWPRVMLRDLMFVMQCVDQDVVEVQLMIRYPEERRIRQRFFQLLVADKRATNLSPLLRFVVSNMLHNRAQFRSGGLARQFQFPIRSEGVNMVSYLLNARERFEPPAKRLVDELLMSNFLDQEKRMTDHDVESAFMDSSIQFLRLITQCKELFDEATLKAANSLLESLCMRFSREWMNTSEFTAAGQKEKKSEKAVTRASQMRTAPKLRVHTSLGGEILGASVARPGSPSARVTKKSHEKESPLAATRGRASTVIVKKKKGS